MIRGYHSIPVETALSLHNDLSNGADWYSENFSMSVASISLQFSLKNVSTIREVFVNVNDYLFPVSAFMLTQVPDSLNSKGVKSVVFLYLGNTELNEKAVEWSEVCLACKLEFKRTSVPVYIVKNSQVSEIYSAELKENKLILYSGVERGGV